MLTVESNETAQAIEIFCDSDGLETLVRKLEILRAKGGHVHLMTPAWAGDELTEEVQGEGNRLLNHLRIVLRG